MSVVSVCACSSICVCVAIPRGNGPQMGTGRQLQDLRDSHSQSKPSPGRLIPDPEVESSQLLWTRPTSWPQASSCLSGLSLPIAPLEVFGGDAVSPAPGSCAGLARENSGHAQASHQRLEAGGPRARRTQAAGRCTRRPRLTAGAPASNGRPSGGPQGLHLCPWLCTPSSG